MRHAETSTEALARLEPQIVFLLEQRKNAPHTWRLIRRGLRAWLEWLEIHEGDSWAERWTSGEAVLLNGASKPVIGGLSYKNITLGQGLILLCALELVRPSYDFILTKDWPGVADAYTHTERQKDFQAIYDTSLELKITKECQKHARSIYTKLALRTGKRLHEITLDDFLEIYRVLSLHSRPRGGTVFHAILRHRGIIADRPMTGKYFQSKQVTTVDDIVNIYSDHQAWWSEPFRTFLKEQEPQCSEARLMDLARNLLRHFWAHIIELNPTQDSFQLTWELSQAWKKRIGEKKDAGNMSNIGIFIDVRTFYHFLGVMAEQVPDTWGKFGAHCPVSTAELQNHATHRKNKRRANNVELSRSLPEMPVLLKELRAAHARSAELLAWARSVPNGTVGAFGEESYRVSESPFQNDYFADDGRIVIKNLKNPNGYICISADEDRTFWLCTTVELLLQTGLRVGELLNFQVTDIATRTDSAGNKIPTFLVAAQKTVRPRIVDISPATLLIVDRVIERVKQERPDYPLASIFLQSRGAYIEDKPLLMQRVVAGRRMGVHGLFVSQYLSKFQRDAIERGILSKDFKVTAKDLRKVYATTLSRNGVPIAHISRLLGHTTIEMTRSYIIDDDVHLDIDALLKF